jgi:MFS family permease
VVLLLGAVSLLNDMSGEVIMAVLPLFLSQLGGGGIAIGLIGGLEEAARSLVSVLSGRWSDRLRSRVSFVWAGYAVAGLARLLLGFSTHWSQALALRVLDRVGKGLRTPARDALIADAVPMEVRGLNFGFHRMMDTGGALLGSLLALVLFWSFSLDVRAIIFVGGALALGSLLPLLFLHERPRSSASPTGESWWAGYTKLSPAFRRHVAAMTVFALGNVSYMFLLLTVHLAYTPTGGAPSKLSLGLPIAMYALYNAVYALLATPAGGLSDRWGRRRVLLFGYGLFGVTAPGFAFAQKLWHFALLFALYGVAYALIEGNQRAFAADLAERERYGTALGVFHMSLGAGALLGGLIAGTLWQTVAPSTTFLYAGALALLGALGLYAASPRHP